MRVKVQRSQTRLLQSPGEWDLSKHSSRRQDRSLHGRFIQPYLLIHSKQALERNGESRVSSQQEGAVTAARSDVWMCEFFYNLLG